MDNLWGGDQYGENGIKSAWHPWASEKPLEEMGAQVQLPPKLVWLYLYTSGIYL